MLEFKDTVFPCFCSVLEPETNYSLGVREVDIHKTTEIMIIEENT